jgi:hypothetical protein
MGGIEMLYGWLDWGRGGLLFGIEKLAQVRVLWELPASGRDVGAYAGQPLSGGQSLQADNLCMFKETH